MLSLLRFPSADFKRAAALAGAGMALATGCLGDVEAKPARPAKAPASYVAVCSWDHPGLSPFMGDVVAAIDRYKDIPLAVRIRLKERMEARQYDEFVAIERDGIIGKEQYEPGIREMHFGDGRVCGVVTRTKWTANMRERGLVYCEGEHCILVPTVCRNVSRIRRKAVAPPPPPPPPPRPVEEPAVSVPEEGGHALYGWLVVQARALEEPGWIPNPRPCGCVPYTPFLPPYSGGPGFPVGFPINPGGVPDVPGVPGGFPDLPSATSPVPEAPTWMMIGVGVLLIATAGRRRRSASAKLES